MNFKKSALLGTLVSALLLVGACTKRPGDSHFVIERPNPKYKLTCLLSGETIELADHRKVRTISKVALRDDLAGTQTQFQPSDAPSLEESQGYFTDVWSPDGEYLALPLGRFEGFALFKASDASKLLIAARFTDSIRVQLKSGTMLWHEFRGWRDKNTLRFGAGLSNQTTDFEYAAASRVLSAAPQDAALIEGVNLNGKVGVTGAASLPGKPVVTGKEEW